MSIPVSKEILRVHMLAEPDTLNPLTASDASASAVQNYVGDSLIERNRDTLEYEPKLALRWEVSEDHLQYVFYLRRDVTWHDNHHFTADDVVYSFEKIQDPSVKAPFLRVYYADIARVEKIDDYTVRFVYKKPYFLGLSVCGGIPLLPKHRFDDGSDINYHPLDRSPVGLGPYRFVEWKTNKKIVLERNENYWGKKPAIKRIEFHLVTDQAIALQYLKKGGLDFAGLRPIQWIKQTDSDLFNSAFSKLKYLLGGYSYIGWNNQSPLFSDKNVRLAMTYMMDRKKLLEKLNYGLGRVVEGPFFIDSPQYDLSLVERGYDPEKGRQLLKDAGWSDSNGNGILDKKGLEFKFKFVYASSSTFAERLAPILKEDLKKAGIEMSIERIEWAAFLDKIEKKDFDATYLGWTGSEEDDPYQVWHSSQADTERGSNFISFKNREADRLMEEARIEFDEKKRNALYHQFQKILYDEQPYTFLFASYSLVAVSKRFKNVIVHKTGLDPLEWEL